LSIANEIYTIDDGRFAGAVFTENHGDGFMHIELDLQRFRRPLNFRKVNDSIRLGILHLFFMNPVFYPEFPIFDTDSFCR